MARYNHGKFIKSDFMSGDVAVVTDQYNKLGEYVVKAGEVIFPGFGQYDSMENAVGRVYAVLKKADDSEITGTYMLTIVSPQDIPLKVLGTWRTEDWNTSASDKTKQIPFSKMNVGASKDKKIVLSFMPDAAATIEYDKVVISMDITRVLLGLIRAAKLNSK